MTRKSAPNSPLTTTGRPIMVLLDQLGQRWTLRILWELKDEDRLTFREIQARCENVSPTLLNKRLKEMRDLQILDHDSGGYGLTLPGKELGEMLLSLNNWSTRWAKKLQ